MPPLSDRALTSTLETSSVNSPATARFFITTLSRMLRGFLILIVVHELLHAVATPRWGMTPQTLIGARPSRLLFYAAYPGTLTKCRFIVVLLTPALVLTIAPLILCSAIRLDNPPLATMSIVNGACACGDLVGAVMIGSQVPQRAVVRNQGWQTWWTMEQYDCLNDV